MELHRLIPNFLRSGWNNYCSLGPKDHFILWLSVGIFSGSTVGYQAYHERQANRSSDHMEVTMYRVDKEKVKAFESAWNDESRLSQMQLGYEWTKMYKAISWENSPFQYISVRMWGRKKYANDFEKNNKSVVEATTLQPPIKQQFVSVVDDSVVRLIH